MSTANQFQQARHQEEQFIKSNLDYENRLRSHMYNFDESENMDGRVRGSAHKQSLQVGINTKANNQQVNE